MKRETGYYWVFIQSNWQIGHYSESDKNWILPRFDNQKFIDADMSEIFEMSIKKHSDNNRIASVLENSLSEMVTLWDKLSDCLTVLKKESAYVKAKNILIARKTP